MVSLGEVAVLTRNAVRGGRGWTLRLMVRRDILLTPRGALVGGRIVSHL